MWNDGIPALLESPTHPLLSTLAGGLLRAARAPLLCRGCLRPLERGAEAGLCAPCWEGLAPLPWPRCPRCALFHADEETCAEAPEWTLGDALWDYHGGRPPLGALLVPGIKSGERGWQAALLRRAAREPLPALAAGADLVTAVPASPSRRWRRGFDLAEEAARLVARRLERPLVRALDKGWWVARQMGRTRTARRLLPARAIRARAGCPLQGRIVLLVDDVWTTGTTLRRCALALKEAGAAEVRVLTLFRSL